MKKVKVTANGQDKTFDADDFQVAQDGTLMLFTKDQVEGSTLVNPRDNVVAYRKDCWDCVEKVCCDEEESSESRVSSGTSSWSKSSVGAP